MFPHRVVGGRRDAGRPGRRRLPAMGLAALLALTLSASALAASGGTGIGGRTQTKHRPVRHVAHAAGNPLAGRGMWIWMLGSSNGGNVASIVAQAHRFGVTTLMIKSGDGSSVWSQFNAPLVSALHANGLRVCAWQYVYGTNPVPEAQVGAAAAHDGADCLIIDAESEYEGKYVQAQAYMQKLRSLIGSSYPLALAGFPYVDYHPGFPYSVFLGPSGAQYNVPQMYWKDIGTTVDAVYAHTFAYNRIYQRPIFPLGQVFQNPPAQQIHRFRQLSRTYGTANVSWWDWQESTGGNWKAISQPVGRLRGSAVVASYARIGQGAAGDVVVWAQEHLVSAGQKITIDGHFGPKTRLAVTSFQTAHGLPASGAVDQATWQALLRYAPARVKWAVRNRHLSATAAAAGAAFVPRSATMHARGYEIPRSLGAGKPGGA